MESGFPCPKSSLNFFDELVVDQESLITPAFIIEPQISAQELKRCFKKFQREIPNSLQKSDSKGSESKSSNSSGQKKKEKHTKEKHVSEFEVVPLNEDTND